MKIKLILYTQLYKSIKEIIIPYKINFLKLNLYKKKSNNIKIKFRYYLKKLKDYQEP